MLQGSAKGNKDCQSERDELAEEYSVSPQICLGAFCNSTMNQGNPPLWNGYRAMELTNSIQEAHFLSYQLTPKYVSRHVSMQWFV